MSHYILFLFNILVSISTYRSVGTLRPVTTDCSQILVSRGQIFSSIGYSTNLHMVLGLLMVSKIGRYPEISADISFFSAGRYILSEKKLFFVYLRYFPDISPISRYIPDINRYIPECPRYFPTFPIFPRYFPNQNFFFFFFFFRDKVVYFHLWHITLCFIVW